MDTKILIFVIASFTLLGISSAKPSSRYIFTCPRSLGIGINNKLQFLRFGNDLPKGNLNIKLYYKVSYDGNETLAGEEEHELPEGKDKLFIPYFVKPFDQDNVYSGRIEISGKLGKKVFGGTDDVQFATTNLDIRIIQTDRPFYKPGDLVQMRILKVDRNLVPSEDSQDVGEVYVEGPDRLRYFQFENVHLGKGLTDLSFQLADDLVKGFWTVTLHTNNETDVSTQFEVKDYVLPKFDTTITFPPYVLANAKFIPIKVCAEYTYNEPVIGKLNLNVSIEQYYYYSYSGLPVLQISVALNGCYTYNLNVTEIDPDNSNRYSRIMVVANVIEEGTGVQRNQTEFLSREFSPLNLNFNVDQNQRQYFKAGIQYNGKLQVTLPDGTPAKKSPINICYTVTRQRVVSDFLGTKQEKFCRNYTSDAKGIIEYSVPPQNKDAIAIDLEASSIKYAQDPSNTDPDQNILSIPQASLSLSPFYSPSGSFIQLETVGHQIECGANQTFKLLFTSEKSQDFMFYYEIVRQSKVIETGSKDVFFDVHKDDISNDCDDKDHLIDGSYEQLVPDPKQTYPTSGGDEDCASTKDSQYTPPVGRTEFKVQVDTNLSPSFSLLVFYVRRDGEVVADSLQFDVQKCFKNKVDFQFGDETKQPGTETTVEISASPHSLCGIKAIDKSVTLLDGSDQLTSDTVFNLIQGFDTGIYYTDDVCNDNKPQPGLQTGSSKVLPPNQPYRSSNFEDALTPFQQTGLLIISDLKLQSRPCTTNNGAFGGGPRPLFEAEESDDVEDSEPESSEESGEASSAPTTSAVEVRNFFPATWLFQLEMTGANGKYVGNRTLPHTITSWVGNAVCVNRKDGLGISNTTSIRAFQAFFISYTLPISAIRGEEFFMVVSISNYAEGDLPITVSLDKPVGFEVTSDSVNEDICVKKSRSSTLRIKVKGTTVGKVNITVRAETSKSKDVCNGSDVSDEFARDAITRSLEIDAEGFPQDKVNSTLFCPNDESNDKFSVEFKLVLPDDLVEGSERAYVDITGNILGPAIANLNDLVSLPTGCGEQNLVTFIPNYLVLDYLTSIGELTDRLKNMAISNLVAGYQRELIFRHGDGSFSAFGDADPTGSVFLTAMVIRAFHEAETYISVDQQVQTQAQNFLAATQQEDGCFPNLGKVIDIQYGFHDKDDIGSITAYVLGSLLVSEYSNQTVIEEAESCLSKKPPTNVYDTFLYAYALALGEKDKEAHSLVEDANAYLVEDEGVEYYRFENGSEAIKLEIVAYAVLTKLKLGESAQGVVPLVRYLTNNMKATGGFYSSQDTVVALTALSEYAAIVYKDKVDLSVTITGGLSKKLEITEDNKLVVNRNKVKVPSTLNVQATGEGCALLQTSLLYNTKHPATANQFYIQASGECSNPSCTQRSISVHISYLVSGKIAGMSIVTIKMVTGIVPVKDSLDQLLDNKDNQILRTDVEGNTVIVYFHEIDSSVSFSFDVTQVIEVENPQPGTATVTEYYVPEISATTSYTFPESKSNG